MVIAEYRVQLRTVHELSTVCAVPCAVPFHKRLACMIPFPVPYHRGTADIDICCADDISRNDTAVNLALSTAEYLTCECAV